MLKLISLEKTECSLEYLKSIHCNLDLTRTAEKEAVWKVRLARLITLNDIS